MAEAHSLSRAILLWAVELPEWFGPGCSSWREGLQWWWGDRPARCLACRLWFGREAFWSPWAAAEPGLCCSFQCLNVVQRRNGLIETTEKDLP